MQRRQPMVRSPLSGMQASSPLKFVDSWANALAQKDSETAFSRHLAVDVISGIKASQFDLRNSLCHPIEHHSLCHLTPRLILRIRFSSPNAFRILPPPLTLPLIIPITNLVLVLILHLPLHLLPTSSLIASRSSRCLKLILIAGDPLSQTL